MNAIISTLRRAALAFALTAAITAISPAFAASADQTEQSQPNRIAAPGPYSGAESVAAALAFN